MQRNSATAEASRDGRHRDGSLRWTGSSVSTSEDGTDGRDFCRFFAELTEQIFFVKSMKLSEIHCEIDDLIMECMKLSEIHGEIDVK